MAIIDCLLIDDDFDFRADIVYSTEKNAKSLHNTFVSWKSICFTFYMSQQVTYALLMMVRKQRPKSMFQWRGFCKVTRHYKNARWWRTIIFFVHSKLTALKLFSLALLQNTIAEGAGQVLYHVWWLYVTAKATQLSPTITLIVVFCLLITCILKQINVSVIYQLLIKDTIPAKKVKEIII